ncbi:EamA-like transporter family protein [Xylanimonas allomyrinae]|uniref:EamA-like transporter family protein n=1 Tax=Xylanimonas allomyrinae TaxID=2509459 RepID=A0A4P6EMK9_9MICO|nr:DMT family transporter [Xylanimonas allomyrinae]QAY62509.1 EamA-like transporter family protein [Xylanimonas allomyrinae]
MTTTASERSAARPSTTRPPAGRPSGTGSSDRVRAAGVAAAVGAGLVSAVQSRVNGSFGAALGNGFLAATINFASALAILALLVGCSPRARTGLGRVKDSLWAGRARATDADRAVHRGVPGIGRLRWFQVVGGAAGGLFVTAQGVTVGSLGVALFVVAVTAGQSVSSLFCDLLGFAPGGRRAITVGRAVGPALAVAAVVVSQWPNLGSSEHLGLVALPLVAGVFVAAQHAVNGRVETTASHAPFGDRVDRGAGALAATFVNFLVGTLALLVVLTVSALVQGLPDVAFPGEWWMYTGGALGVVFIGTAAAVVHRIGALLLALSLIAGQITGALLLDLAAGGTPAVSTLAGVALTLAAIAVPVLTSRSRRGA